MPNIEFQRNNKTVKDISRHLISGLIIDDREKQNPTISKFKYESIRKASMIQNKTKQIRGRFSS